jgi:ribonuclease HII
MIIIGVDEAGRGPLAGNVVAGAVVLKTGLKLEGLTDSKKISAKNREILYDLITSQCQWAVGMASVAEIDEINILQATMLAMRRAIENLNVKYDKVLVDGNRCPEVEHCTAIIKGDLTQPVISAASIIAKVTRDRQMFELDEKQPNYGFAKHKGYGTKQHLEALSQYGLIKGVHRETFAPVKKLKHL